MSDHDAGSTNTHLAGHSRVALAFYALVRGLVHIVVAMVTRIRISGRTNLPADGAYVIAPVHRSYIDTPIVACITRRRIRFMGKQEMWKYPRIGWVFSALGGFPVARGSADREALRRCIAVLEQGEPLVLFPEGERKDGPIVQPLFDGAAFVAARARVPIVPVGIGGSARVMPRGAKRIYARKVHVVIGEPIVAEVSERGRVSRRAIADMTERLSVDLQRLFDEAQSRVG
ncbi:MAG: lysophospholipid acyltransferase family protein [Actinomycetota bacterium]